MTKSNSMEELVNTIYSFSFLLNPVIEYAVCLCEDWKFDFENTAVFREHGFSERMVLAVGRNADGEPETNRQFLLKDLLPDPKRPHEPQLKVFISLHHETQIFGYIAFTYPDAQKICLDDHFMNWCNAAANGLDALQKRLYQEYIRQQLEVLSVLDPATGLYNKRGLMEHLPKFISHSEKHKQNYMCMLISYVQKNGIAAQFGGDPELLIANALRLSSNDDELLCRLQKDVFALILPISDDNTEIHIQERIMQLEEKIHYMQGSSLQLQIPELVTDYCPLQFDRISKAGTVIEEMQQCIQQKAEAAAIMTGNYRERLHRLRREIHAYPQSSWNIPEMSRSIGISNSHFQRMYKSVFGIGFKDDLIAARIEKAKTLLRSTELRVQEVADACGYRDYSHFMRQFKDKTGVPALQYRKQNT